MQLSGPESIVGRNVAIYTTAAPTTIVGCCSRGIYRYIPSTLVNLVKDDLEHHHHPAVPYSSHGAHTPTATVYGAYSVDQPYGHYHS